MTQSSSLSEMLNQILEHSKVDDTAHSSMPEEGTALFLGKKYVKSCTLRYGISDAL